MAAMSASTRWNPVVSVSTDRALRQLLAEQGGDSGLSQFVEEAVRSRILAIEAARAKQQNATVPAAELETAIDEALDRASRN